jgi:hypothetical protein
MRAPRLRPSQRTLAVAAAALVAAAACLFGCGSGDDTNSVAPVIDAGAPDATMKPDGAACVPDSGPSPHCNACVSPSADPHNACSRFVTACVPFDGARVPAHPML